MNFSKTDFSSVLVFLVIIGAMFLIPEMSYAQVNLQSAAQNLSSNILKIGLSATVISLIIGGAMMGFGNPKGTMMVTASMIGGVVMLSATGIVKLLSSSIN